MGAFMATHGIQAGALAVMKDGQVVYDRGAGWRDQARSTALGDSAMLRLASVTKPVTAAAVRHLVADGLLELDARVFDVGQPGGGVLALEPFPAPGDPRLADVTIRYLLQHRGGWDRAQAGDLTYREVQIAAAMGVNSPPGRAATVRYILGQPLQFTPGTREAYSNIGYLVLGLIIEEVSGTDFMGYVHDNVFAPLGVARRDVARGRTFPADRDPREPWYDAHGLVTNVFDPAGPPVRAPAGGWDHEARAAQGGLVATARALLHLAEAHQVSGADIGVPRTGDESAGWRRNHTGSLPGTNTLIRQRGDGVNYVVLFNRSPASGTSFAALFRTQFDALLDGGAVRWP
jgi:CubicO group peptidase (beta-lactamase class C family)